MARQHINIGNLPNDGSGDPIRTAFDKVNQNFTDLYTSLTKEFIGLGNVDNTSDATKNSASVTLTNKTISAPTITGNLTFSGTGNRITGDFSNTTHANRVMFRTDVTDGATAILALPNGTSQIAQANFYSSSTDPDNASMGQFAMVGGESVRVLSSKTGTGTYLPMTFWAGGDKRMTLDTSGRITTEGTPVTNGNARATLYLKDNSAFATGVGGGITFQAKYNSAGAYFDAGNIKGIKENATDGNFGGALVFATHPSGDSPAERMRIDSSGNVGIGTSPASGYRLHILGGNLLMQGTTPGMRFASAGAVNNWYFGANISDAVNGGFLIGRGVSIGSGTPDVTIDYSGVATCNNGIKPSSGSDTLSVYDEVAAWTPTITAQTGSFTSASGSMKYTRIGNVMHCRLAITITTNGTAAGWVYSTLPVTPAEVHWSGYGFNTSISRILHVFCDGGSGVVIRNATDMTYPGGTGSYIVCSFTYFV